MTHLDLSLIWPTTVILIVQHCHVLKNLQLRLLVSQVTDAKAIIAGCCKIEELILSFYYNEDPKTFFKSLVLKKTERYFELSEYDEHYSDTELQELFSVVLDFDEILLIRVINISKAVLDIIARENPKLTKFGYITRSPWDELWMKKTTNATELVSSWATKHDVYVYWI